MLQKRRDNNCAVTAAGPNSYFGSGNSSASGGPVPCTKHCGSCVEQSSVIVAVVVKARLQVALAPPQSNNCSNTAIATAAPNPILNRQETRLAKSKRRDGKDCGAHTRLPRFITAPRRAAL